MSVCFPCALRIARKLPQIPCTCRSPRTIKDRIRDHLEKLRKEEAARPPEEIKLSKGTPKREDYKSGRAYRHALQQTSAYSDVGMKVRHKGLNGAGK